MKMKSYFPFMVDPYLSCWSVMCAQKWATFLLINTWESSLNVGFTWQTRNLIWMSCLPSLSCSGVQPKYIFILFPLRWWSCSTWGKLDDHDFHVLWPKFLKKKKVSTNSRLHDYPSISGSTLVKVMTSHFPFWYVINRIYSPWDTECELLLKSGAHHKRHFQFVTFTNKKSQLSPKNKSWI